MQVQILKHVVDVEALVESASQQGAFYRVTLVGGAEDSVAWQCSCPDFAKRGDKRACKHIQPVRDKVGI